MKYVRSIEQFSLLKGNHLQYKYFDTLEKRDDFNNYSEFRNSGGENLYLYTEDEHEYAKHLESIISDLKEKNAKMYTLEAINEIYKEKLKPLNNKIKELESKQENFEIEKFENLKMKNNELINRLNQANKNIINLRENIEVEKAKNNNLMRIMKERSNAKRGLKPKKEHAGYLPIFNKETVFAFKYKERNMIKSINYNVWRLKLQTPYSIKLELNYIKNDIEDYFLHSDNNFRFNYISRFDFKSIIEQENKEDIKRFKDIMEEKKIAIFKIEHEANFRSGLWEISFLSNKEIKIDESLK
ncbi:MAG: hypothetical protein ACRDDY_14990 [Clostridium sp.]|uniref:hypothetical protein n=1 Tax=Clostridium sp. TaxID=1506 RepID=UPI003EE4F7EF